MKIGQEASQNYLFPLSNETLFRSLLSRIQLFNRFLVK